MKKLTVSLVVILTMALGIFSGTIVSAGGGENNGDVCSLEITPGTVEPYLVNGEAVIPIGEGTLVVKDFSGMTREDILESIKMLPEEEAKIVHQVPSCPVTIDGIEYAPEEIHLFDGIQLGFIAGKDGNLYAFTTEEGLAEFKEQEGLIKESAVSALLEDEIYSNYYEEWWYGGKEMTLHYAWSIAEIPPEWNDVISSIQITTYCACRLYEHSWFGGDYYEATAGTSDPWLFWSGWNDRVSSILHLN